MKRNIINTFKLKIGLKKDIYKKNYDNNEFNYWRNEINKNMKKNYDQSDNNEFNFYLIIFYIIFLITLWFFTYIIIPLN